VDEVRYVLEHKYKANKSSGLSQMPVELLKYLSEEAVDSLCFFLNTFLKFSLPPTDWRTLKVVPLYKGHGDITDCDNYRAIAIMSPIPKLIMSIINHRLEKVSEDRSLRTPT